MKSKVSHFKRNLRQIVLLPHEGKLIFINHTFIVCEKLEQLKVDDFITILYQQDFLSIH